jgi:hypothetical protein
MNTVKDCFFEQIKYCPHEKQRLFHDSQARFRIVAAGARSGKSMAAGAEIAFELCHPNKRIWCVATQYELADKEFDWALQFLQKIADGNLLAVARVSSAARGSRIIRFPWGSFCKTKSTEKPTSLLGEELDLIVLSEASQIARAPWERMLRARLGPRNGKLIAPSTPNSDSGLFREFFENGQNENPEFSDWESWQFSTLDNPTFSKSEWEIARKELDESIFQEQYMGLFVSRRGHVFKLTKEHIYKEPPQGFQDWPVIRAYQAGYQNPAVCLFMALSPDREYYIFQEIYKSQTVIEDIAPEIIKASLGKRVIGTIVDFRDTNTQDKLKMLKIANTVIDEKKFNSKLATLRRLQALQNVMKVHEVHEGGKTRLHIHASCENLIRELSECKWPEKQKEEDEKAEIELPTTKYLQGPLALSYLVGFIETSRGVDIYTVQGRRDGRSFENANK